MKRIIILFSVNIIQIYYGGFLNAQSLVNGSYESASVNPGNAWVGLSVGNTSINGWTVVSGNIDYVGNLWGASEGTRSVDLNGNRSGSISQSINTMEGQNYLITFDLAGNPDSGPTVKTLRLSVGDSSNQYSFNISGHTHQNMGWETKTFEFLAVDAISTITFASLSGGAYGPVVDNVRIEKISANKKIPIESEFLLNQNHPNLFTSSTTISYNLLRSGFVEVVVYNLIDQKVKTLISQKQQVGEHQIQWDGKTEQGIPAPAGVYSYRLRMGQYAQARRMLLLR